MQGSPEGGRLYYTAGNLAECQHLDFRTAVTPGGMGTHVVIDLRTCTETTR